MTSNSLIAIAGTIGAFVLAGARPAVAWADPAAEGEGRPAPVPRADDEVPAPPPTYEANGVTVDEHVGGRVPLDATFRTQDGTPVTLGDVLRGGLPAILTFNYSDCPMLCSVQLNGLTAVLPTVGERGPSPDRGKGDVLFRVGVQFRIVTIDLEPNETLDKAQAMRRRYIDRLPEDQRAAAQAGWTFLVASTPGDGAAIRRVADAVGFRYTYIKDRAEWAHPAALIFLSASGAVTRYLYGIEFDPTTMRESIYKAGIAEPAAAVGFMIRCYHYDPGANSHARAGVMALRFGAAGFLVLLLGVLGVMHRIRRSIPRGGGPGFTPSPAILLRPAKRPPPDGVT
jgi:protein SCO1/2